MSRHVGIDLGTTNSVVAFVEGSQAETILNSEGQKITPSVVLFKEEETIVGELAKRQMVASPRMIVRSAKRLMGRRFSEVSERLGEFPFRVVEGPEDSALIELEGGRRVAPEQVSAEILKKMRTTAEDFLGEDVLQAVVTVPAHFNDSQRVATKRAAEMAGIEVLRIINEPTAAALAYGIARDKEEKIAVFDFGGGTFDVTILQLSGGIFEVLSTNGDTQLGGDNLDHAMVQWMLKAIREETHCDPSQDPQALQRIYESAEKVKCELSTLTSTTISLPFIVADASGPKHFHREISREFFINLITPLLENLKGPCEQALSDANLKPDKIGTVLLVGGSTRIPAVQQIARDIFHREPNRSINPDEAVALGAAIQSGIITGELTEILLLDVVPLSLGIELAGGLFKPLIARNSSIPTTATRRFTTVVDNQSSVMVHVLQGERATAKDNRTLARFRLAGITRAPREVPEIEVRFHVDANGILEVSAQDMTSGLAQSIVVESYPAVASSESDVERVISEAEQHSAEDQAFLKSSQHLQRIQQIQYDMQNFLDAAGEQVTEEDLKKIKEDMFKLDMIPRGQKWIEIDAIEMDFITIRGKYKITQDPFLKKMGTTSGAVPESAGAFAELDLSGAENAAVEQGANETAPPSPPASQTSKDKTQNAAKTAARSDSSGQKAGSTPDLEEEYEEAGAGKLLEEHEVLEAGKKAVGKQPKAEVPAPDSEEPVPPMSMAEQATDRGTRDADENSPQQTPGASLRRPAPPSAQPSGPPKKFTPPSWLFPAQQRKPPDGSQNPK